LLLEKLEYGTARAWFSNLFEFFAGSGVTVIICQIPLNVAKEYFFVVADFFDPNRKQADPAKYCMSPYLSRYLI
jgi:hypothetical protein